MKIGIYDPYLDTMSGGEKYMLTAALSLADEHDVFVFWDTKKKEEIITKAKERFNFNVSKLTFVDSIFTRETSLLKRLTVSHEYDAIIVLSDGSIPLLACDLFVHFQSPMEWVSPSSFFSRIKLWRTTLFITNSEFTKKYIDKRFNIISKVIYPPVYIQREYDESKKQNRILHVGRFGIMGSGSSYKKQDVLADAFASMVDEGLKGYKLVFVMSVMREDMDECKKFQEKYAKYPIEFVINPKNTTLWEEYEKAKIYWHASGFGESIAQHPDRAEHFGISTVEAMGVGAVPIVYKAGGQIEIVTEESGLTWESVDQLKEYTKEIIKDEKRRKNYVQNGVERARLFSNTVFSEKIQMLFK